MKSIIALLSAFMLVAAFAAKPKKYIFTGWDINDATPREILDHAEKFNEAGCDGVGVKLDPSCSDSVNARLHIAEYPRWSDFDLDPIKSVCSDFRKHPSLRQSFFFVNFAPRKNRLSWTDDAAWRLYADNAAVAARIAKETGFEGLIADFEDYWRKKQFRHLSDDPDWATTKKLARSRAREVFAKIFGAYPEITILAFQLLTTDTAYARKQNPVAYMETKRDLWPSFVNGILDVLPPKAKLVDGNESCAYVAEASRNDFYRSVRDQLVGVMPLVSTENRAKYRAQMSVSFGLYLDSYAVSTNSTYYFGPVRDKRITHFEENLRQATECADEYVWFWGEKGFYIDWPADMKEKSGDKWRSSGGGTWRRKYFEGSWGRIKPWRDTIDGDVDLVMRGLKNPVRCVLEAYERQKSSGKFRNLYTDRLEKEPCVLRTARVANVEMDGWYGVTVRGRGDVLRVRANFQDSKGWRWDLGEFQMEFPTEPIDGWHCGAMLVRVPEGATRIFLHLDSGKAKQPVKFKDLEVFRIR